MAVKISYTFLINGDWYALIGMAEDDRALSKQFGMSRRSCRPSLTMGASMVCMN